MNKAETGRFLGILVLFLGIAALPIALKGEFLFGFHEMDMMHLVSLVLREAAGRVPHLDFSTPIGEWSYALIALLVKAGLGLGPAMLWAQWGVAALCAPAVAWIGWSRFGFWAAIGLAALVISVPVALTYGSTDLFLSLSMHYNRWAWALAFLVVPVVLFPPAQGRAGDWADAMVLGLPMAALVMIKVTYVAALAPACILGLLVTGRARLLLRAVVLALALLGVVTLVRGAGYWPAYLSDLLRVTGSEIRSHPGLSLPRILLSPAYTMGTLAALAAVVLLRAIPGRQAAGLTLLVMLPGLAYIAYQNFGNDPLWLGVLGLCLLGLPGPEADPDRERILRSIGAVMLILIGPVLLNLGYSPFRHLAQDRADYSQVLPGEPGFRTLTRRSTGVGVTTPWVGSAAETVSDPDDPLLTRFAGQDLPDCVVQSGILPYFRTLSEQMAGSAALDGRMPFVADAFSPTWIFAGWEPLRGGTPWYYAGLPGYANATHLMVPLCATVTQVRTEILEQIDPGTLELVEENALYRLYRILR